MSEDEQLEYFEAMKWFEGKYTLGGEIEILLKYMYSTWPDATLRLAHQGYFMAIAKAN